jgi:hypothetical protein
VARPEQGRGDHGPPLDDVSPRQRRRRGLALAVALPAVTAAAVVMALAGDLTLGAPASDAPRPPTLAEMPGLEGRAPVADPPHGARPARPRSIALPKIGVDAPVDPVAVGRGGTLRVPALGRTGWFEGGPRPGEVGRTVILGHLDTDDGPAVFERVADLKRGAPVAITDRRGEVHRYRVTGRRQVAKRRFPTGEVYGRAGEPVLVLVTCGGEFVPGRGYEDNVLVYARAA